MNKLDFLKFAKYLLEQNTNFDEALARTSISRAYYCLYHVSFDYLLQYQSNQFLKVIRSYLRPEQLVDTSRMERLEKDYLKNLDLNYHVIIPKTFISLRPKYFKRIAKDFSEFRLKRNYADYDFDQFINKDDADAIVTEIENMMSQLK